MSDSNSDAERIIRDFFKNDGDSLDELSCIEKSPSELSGNKNGDPQVISLKTALTQIISEIDSPVVMDFGAGKGTLIPLLAEIQGFENENGTYIAVNKPVIEDDLKLLFTEYDFYRKPNSRLIDFEDFFGLEMDGKCNVIVIKNVIHEIDSIKELGDVLYNIFGLLSPNGCIVLQDMQILKQPELGNCPYLVSDMENLFKKSGFITNLTTFNSYSGIPLYTLVARKNQGQYSSKDISEILLSIRKAQRKPIRDKLYEQYESKKTPDKYLCIVQHFDLFAIEKQISDYNNESNPYSSIDIFKHNLALNENNFYENICGKKKSLLDIPWFNNRGQAFKVFTNQFMNSKNSTFLLLGPKNIGKTTFAFESLKSRNPDRNPLYIKIPKYCDYWKFLYLLFNEFEVNISLNDFNGDEKKDISNLILEIIGKFAGEIIFCFDDFENLLEDRSISDPDLEYFMNKLSQISEVKCIIISNKNINGSDSLFNNCLDYKLRLFPKDYHVIQMFDTLISKERYGIKDYPEELIQAIGKHPAIAYLVGKTIQKSGSIELVMKHKLDSIKHQIVNSILDNLEMSHLEENVLQIMSLLVGSEKIQIIEKLIDDTKLILKLSEEGLIYYYNDKYFILETLRDFYRIQAKQSTNYQQICNKIASVYLDESIKSTGNKKIEYYRKYVNFELSMGETNLNIDVDDVYFTSEILELADTFYKFNDYKDALKIYKKLAEKSPLLKYKLKIAACYVRLDNKKGDENYNSLINETNLPRIKSSYISSLIAADRYSDALGKLLLYFGKNVKTYHPYQIGQRAKIEDNLGNYDVAEDLYYKHLNNFCSDYNLLPLINMYMKLYENQTALNTIESYEGFFSKSKLLLTEKSKVLERLNRPDDAYALLNELFENDKQNAHIILPYVKVLLSLNKSYSIYLDIAKNVLQESSDSKPHDLYIQAKVLVEIESKKFSEAERLLDYHFQDKSKNSLHINSLKATHYYKKAIFLKESNISDYKSSLYKALNYTKSGFEFSNIPLLMQRLDILRELGDEILFEKTQDFIHKINPKIAISK